VNNDISIEHSSSSILKSTLVKSTLVKSTLARRSFLFGSILLTASPLSAVVVTNPGFEDNNPGGLGYGAITGWTGGSGVNNASQPFLEQAAHSGTQVAFIQASGTISQTLTGFDPTKTYSVTYFVSERGSADVGAPASSTSVSLNGGTTSFSYSGNIVKTDAFRRVVSGPLAVSGVSSTIQLNAISVSGDNSLLIDSVTVGRAVPVVTNGGFETPVQPTDSALTRFKQAGGGGQGSLGGSTWDFVDGGGITRNSSAFAPPAAPEGSQAAILQNISQFSTTVSGFEAGVSYSLSFEAAGRTGGANPFQVLLNGSALTFGASTTITPSVGSYGSFTSTAFTTTGGPLLLEFIGTDPLGDNTSFIDDIRFNFVAEAIPEPSAALLGGLGALLLLRRRR
jgi:hypothetical protein